MTFQKDSANYIFFQLRIYDLKRAMTNFPDVKVDLQNLIDVLEKNKQSPVEDELRLTDVALSSLVNDTIRLLENQNSAAIEDYRKKQVIFYKPQPRKAIIFACVLGSITTALVGLLSICIKLGILFPPALILSIPTLAMLAISGIVFAGIFLYMTFGSAKKNSVSIAVENLIATIENKVAQDGPSLNVRDENLNDDRAEELCTTQRAIA